MKTFTLFIALFLWSLITNAQRKTGDIQVINDYLSLKKTEKGYVFTDYKGTVSKEYTYVYVLNSGFIETTIVPPPDKRVIYASNPCYTTDNTEHKTYHIFELMKELGTIEKYSFENELTFSNIKDGRTGDYGWVLINGKYAMANPKGEFITEPKYDYQGSFSERGQPFRNRTILFNQRTENGKKVTVIMDKFTGNELFTTKDSIVKYWNLETHILKTAKNKYYLTYQSKKHQVSEKFIYLRALPVDSSVYTYYRDNNNCGFMDERGNKIESELKPLTNFYKGHCIVLEKCLEEQKYNYYGEPLYRKEITAVKLINEQFETVKILENYTESDRLQANSYRDYFNDYGQIVVHNRKEATVMDYTGAIVFKIEQPNVRINEIYKGVYEVSDNGVLYSNFYNQKGEKLINQKLLNMYRFDSFKFKEGISENYFTLYYHPNFPLIKLNKNNDIIFSEYQ